MILPFTPRSHEKYDWLLSYYNGDEECLCILYQISNIDVNTLLGCMVDEQDYQIHLCSQLPPEALDSNRVPTYQIWVDDLLRPILSLPCVKPTVDYDIDNEGDMVVTIKCYDANGEEVAL